MIEVDVRAKSYGSEPVLKDIRFSMQRAARIAILGPSGIGKSTLLRIIAGIDTEFEGEVSAPPAMAMVFQEPTLLPWRSVAANLTLVHPGLSEERAEAALASVGLAGKGGLFPGQLSLGQQRRLALARAFAGAPDVLLLDEPFVSLDRETAGEMVALTRTLLETHDPAMLLVTHNPEEADALGAQHIHLSGNPATLG